MLVVPGGKTAQHLALSDERRKAIGDKVKAAREQAGLTHESLAHASGVYFKHIQRIERGDSNPTLATGYALADALGLRLQDLLPD